MRRRLEARLGGDARLRAALPRGDGALVVWDGDWVLSDGQEGRGFARLRQAMVVEVAFAPEACRRQPVRGWVAIALGDTHVALGAGLWRWSDLLFVPGARPSSR